MREGDPSRWNSAAGKRWIPIRREKVCAVAFDQLEVPLNYDLYDVLES